MYEKLPKPNKLSFKNRINNIKIKKMSKNNVESKCIKKKEK